MSILRDVIDVNKELENGMYSKLFNKERKFSSSVEASKGILQFPVLCTTTLSLEDANMINKALEREFVSFIRVVTSMQSITGEKDIESYLKTIHQNFNKNDMSTASIIFNGAVKPQLNESAKYQMPIFKILSQETVDGLNRISESLNEMLFDDLLGDDELEDLYEEVDCANLDCCEEEDVNMIKTVSQQLKDEGYCVNRNSKLSGIVASKDGKLLEAKIYKKDDTYFEFRTLPITETQIYDESLAVSRGIKLVEGLNIQKLQEYDNGLRMDILNDKTKSNNYLVIGENSSLVNKNNNLYGSRLNLSEASTKATDFNGSGEGSKTIFNDNLTSNDIKKANELVPTMLHLKTYFKNNDGNLQAIDYVIGIKATLHPIDSNSMVENLVRGVKRNRNFFNFLKWSTGEIEFFKDFVLTLDDIKTDIKGKFKDSPWWDALRRRKKKAAILSRFKTMGSYVPNTTIVASIDEINDIKNNNSIDLMDPKVVMQLIQEYFLLGFVIVDSSSEVAYFFFDGETNFMKHSFASLERENSNQAKEVKNIMQILGKM